jgi:uncharacterized protein (DUF488 family)
MIWGTEAEMAQYEALPELMTIGHSNRGLPELIAMLQAYSVDLVADVRKLPRSHFNPQFNKDELPGPLQEAGIGYRHLPELGGLRKARPDSTNTAWENRSFRGYADYMQTAGFEAGLRQLLALAEEHRVAVMCAEAVPWQCHRSLIADALSARGVPVKHILSADRIEPHRMTAFARVEEGRVTYPSEQTKLF